MTDLETAIADFLALGRRLQGVQELTGERVLDEVTAWYRDSRVEGAAVEEDGDMLLLQWGAIRPAIVTGPTDLRRLGDGAVMFAAEKSKYLDFTRQVSVAGEAFDDAAVQMSVLLGFAAADGSEPMSDRWIAGPDEVEDGRRDFLAEPFVGALIASPARTVAVTVGYCG